MNSVSAELRRPWLMREAAGSEEQTETEAAKRRKTMRTEILRKLRLKWVFFFISHETSDALNATFFSFSFSRIIIINPSLSRLVNPKWVFSERLRVSDLRRKRKMGNVIIRE
jgi:hypothetical protein